MDAFVKDILVPHIKKLGLIWQAGGHGLRRGGRAARYGDGILWRGEGAGERREYLAMIRREEGTVSWYSL